MNNEVNEFLAPFLKAVIDLPKFHQITDMLAIVQHLRNIAVSVTVKQHFSELVDALEATKCSYPDYSVQNEHFILKRFIREMGVAKVANAVCYNLFITKICKSYMLLKLKMIIMKLLILFQIVCWQYFTIKYYFRTKGINCRQHDKRRKKLL